MERISCVIFDLDGTLADTGKLIFASFNHIAERYTGRTWSETEILATFGPTEEVAIREIVGQARSEAAIEDFHRFYAKAHDTLAAEHNGIREVIVYLRANGVILALFTGKGKRTTAVTLTALGMDGLFELIITGDDVERHKPSDEGIRKVLSAFGVPPSGAVMVGDSAADIAAAHSAGVRAASVAWDPFARGGAELPGADLNFSSVAEFASFIRSAVPHNPGMRAWN